VRAAWKYHGISAVRVAEDLAGLPAKLDRVDALVADGVLGGEQPTAADLQVGATLRVLLTIGDLQPLMPGARSSASRAAGSRLRRPDPCRRLPESWLPAAP
jgi:glutathione S-transferase